MGDHRTTPQLKKWTVMIYLAGDNNLESYALKDLSEMSGIGSSSEVALVAQLDRVADQTTRRYFMTSPSLEDNCVAELGETNTGDPQVLLDFIIWAAQTHPAEQYALILWNHGAGWKDDDIYKIVQSQEIAGKVTGDQIRGLARGKVSRALFRSSLECLVIDFAQTERAILFDDSSADFLDNLELRWVLQKAVEQIGRPLDLIGFDACLMNMLEVHYQIRDLCRVAVGSQELEPGDGWPYDAILTSIIRNPQLTAEDLGHVIVEGYINFYQTHFPNLSVTQSAILLNSIDALVEVLEPVAKWLTDCLPEREALRLIFSALRSTQRFSDHDYVDLAHFCRLLTSYDPDGEIGKAARLVTNLLDGKESPVIAEGHHGANVENSHGISIYLPARNLSPLYHRLEFAQQHAWGEFLKAFTFPG